MTDNRISRAFARGKAFIPFVTSGDPDLATTEALVRAMVAAGADLVELGLPFSDPVAEGPVIEAASARALAGGVKLEHHFELVARLRADLDVPLVFMTYYNPIFAHGVESFLERAAAVGLDGLIVPDLPFEERAELADPCRRHGLSLISLVAPTSAGRVAAIAAQAEGFLYCVSSLGVTGVRDSLGDQAAQLVAQARPATKIPCAVGFGIATPDQAKAVARFADGVIVGSAIVRLVAEHGRAAVPVVRDYVAAMRGALGWVFPVQMGANADLETVCSNSSGHLRTL
ncbi:MAG: tryptophan synthase subunit alpha [Propionibacteriaceae bacterium]|jgi:tryptophan synthase alpha chain|nr:tryptophan synthase subunit alpha [Propionibacteriaceae bacterium]